MSKKFPLLAPRSMSEVALTKKRKEVAEIVVGLVNKAKSTEEFRSLVASAFGLKELQRLGSGAYREVFALPYSLVLKMAKGCHSNAEEYRICNTKKYREYVPQCFAHKCRKLKGKSYWETGVIDILVSERVKPISTGWSDVMPKYRAKYNDFISKFYFGDNKAANCGLNSKGNIVAVDLGNAEYYDEKIRINNPKRKRSTSVSSPASSSLDSRRWAHVSDNFCH